MNQFCNSGAEADSATNGAPIDAANKAISQNVIPLDGGTSKPCAMPSGSVNATAASTARCTIAARAGVSARETTCA